MQLPSSRSLRVGAVVLFAVFWLIGQHVWVPLSEEPVLAGDALCYTHAAFHLLHEGFYSQDGVVPLTEREPGESLFLTAVYAVFGPYNVVASFAAHALFYLLAVWLFVKQFGTLVSRRAADLTFLFLLTMPSAFHAILSLNRESVALSFFLCATAAIIALSRRASWSLAAFAGLLFGGLILTYGPYLLFPFFLVIVWWALRIPWKYLAATIGMIAFTLSPWVLRNEKVAGMPCLTGCYRDNVQWYVRGEMVTELHGLEPLRCLWSEYISRDWTGRSPFCSFNTVMHRAWPNGVVLGAYDVALGDSGKHKILTHLGSELWLGLFKALELHLPYVDFWGFRYNLLTSLSTLLLYIGALFSVPVLFRDRRLLALLLLPPLYTTGVFSLTDAIPRYLLPVIFCYAACAGIGYDRLVQHFHARRKRRHSGI